MTTSDASPNNRTADRIGTVVLLMVHAVLALGSAALVVADVVISTVRIARKELAYFVPLLFCGGQVLLYFVGQAVASLAGPLNS